MPAVIATIAPLIERLGSREAVGYGAVRIPCPLDNAARLVVAAFATGSGVERAAICDRITARVRSALSAYGERMASLSVRTGDRALLRSALIAAAVGWCYEDPRESLLILPLFYDAALRIGLDPGGLFRDVAALAREDAKEAIADFPDRAPEDRSLACMGYREGLDGDGFRYVRGW